MTQLTLAQRKLRNEVKKIAAAVSMDVWNIEDYDADARATYLKIMKDRLIRSEVVTKYTLVDEYLTMIICNYYFRRKPMSRGHTYRQLMKTKRFRIFVHYLMDKTFLVPKLELVDAIKPLPQKVKSAIHRINEVRNAIAHNFFPETLRRYAADKKVMYNGVHLFSFDGLTKLHEDFHLIDDHLLPIVFGPALAAATRKLRETNGGI